MVSDPVLGNGILPLHLPALLRSTVSNFILTDSPNTMKSAMFFICGFQPDRVRSNWTFKFTRLKIKQVLNYRELCVFT